MDVRKEVAKRTLKRYIVKHNATYRGIPVLEFNEEELLKILDIYIYIYMQVLLKEKMRY